ncbi:MAG: hypothetical protein IPK16_16500 [Anaerolineales bacterium]|nr:hypothetical protein [Anaerolineales bacterium]
MGNNNGYGVVAAQAGYSNDDVSAGYYESGVLGGGYSGVIGFSKAANGFGVFGHASRVRRHGGPGTTDATNGWAVVSLSGAGNGVSISTPAGKVGLTVAGGTKNAVVATADGARCSMPKRPPVSGSPTTGSRPSKMETPR